MHKVEFYQTTKSSRWRWKMLYNKKVLARGEGHYATRSACKKAFMGIRKAIDLHCVEYV